jgi:hypothetical protein
MNKTWTNLQVDIYYTHEMNRMVKSIYNSFKDMLFYKAEKNRFKMCWEILLHTTHTIHHLGIDIYSQVLNINFHKLWTLIFINIHIIYICTL